MESEYNLGRDLTIFAWLSVVCFLGAFGMTLALGLAICFVVRKDKNYDERKAIRVAHDNR
jgi:hypothetical protein